MRKPAAKRAIRLHYLDKWLHEREMDPMDLLNALNEASDDDEDIIDKSQVYRWLKGQVPQDKTLERIAAVLDIKPTEALLRHPTEHWIIRELHGRSDNDIKRARQAIDLVLPSRIDR